MPRVYRDKNFLFLMSVIVETTEGSITIDLHTKSCPRTCTNFLKLCKMKYYNNCLIFNVQKDFIAQTGDPTGTGKGGSSIWGKIKGPENRFFQDEIDVSLKHSMMGTVAMANKKPHTNASQFYITLRDNISYLDKTHTIFGQVVEGLDVLQKINEAFVNEHNRPYVDMRITHTFILDDPFDDPQGFSAPTESPQRSIPEEETVSRGLTQADLANENEGMTTEEIEKREKKNRAQRDAIVLEILGDIPNADVKPPENVLFVCKLNEVTEDSDLKMIFHRFGVKSCEIIRDRKTGDSLCYAFIEMDTAKGAEDAYFKMNNVLIDDRRIKVDFSQSVSKLWNSHRRGETMSKQFEFDKKNYGGKDLGRSRETRETRDTRDTRDTSRGRKRSIDRYHSDSRDTNHHHSSSRSSRSYHSRSRSNSDSSDYTRRKRDQISRHTHRSRSPRRLSPHRK